MRLGNFAVEIINGYEQANGYVLISHNTKYIIRLLNFGEMDSDAEVEIDDKLVGIWRVPSKKVIDLERPVNDTGRFTFYRFNTEEAAKAGLIRSEKLGLISVLFKPEKHIDQINIDDIDFSLASDTSNRAPGGTGLSGKSDQNFHTVTPLNYDEMGFVRINLRLCSEVDDKPRPLVPISTPVPPSLFK